MKRPWLVAYLLCLATGLMTPAAQSTACAQNGGPLSAPEAPHALSRQQLKKHIVASNAGTITVRPAVPVESTPSVSEAWPATAPHPGTTLREPVSAPPASIPIEMLPSTTSLPQEFPAGGYATAASNELVVESTQSDQGMPRQNLLVPSLNLSDIPQQPPIIPVTGGEPETSMVPGPSTGLPFEYVNSDEMSLENSYSGMPPSVGMDETWSNSDSWEVTPEAMMTSDEFPLCGRQGCPTCSSRLFSNLGGNCEDWCPEPDPCGRLLPFGNLGAKPGNDRTIGGGEIFLPVWQRCDSLVFTDFRGAFDDNNAGEALLGVGYRTFVDPRWILGVYGYADIIATNQRNTFAQGQFGVELMSLNWEFRINGYAPGSNDQSARTMSGVSNGTVVTRNFRERAYPGFDLEFGHRLLHWGWNDRYELRGFVGAYRFDDSTSGYPTISGPRGRLEMRIYDLGWFGQQSRLEFGIQASHDSVRDDQFFGYFRLRIPFGGKLGRPVLDPLRRRLVDTPIHRLDLE